MSLEIKITISEITESLEKNIKKQRCILDMIYKQSKKNTFKLVKFYFSTAFENQIGESKRYRRYWFSCESKHIALKRKF
jgi:hypothetical protein